MSAERRNYRKREGYRVTDIVTVGIRSPLMRGRRLESEVDLSQLPNRTKATIDPDIASGARGAPDNFSFGRSTFDGDDTLI